MPFRTTPIATAQSPGPLAAFFALADVWKLSTDQQIALLGSPARSTYFKWKKEGGTLSVDQEDRVSHLLSISRRCRCSSGSGSRRCLDGPSPSILRRPLGVRSHTAGGKLEDIVRVRDFVDAQRGG